MPHSGRFDVAGRQAEIGMVKHIKQFNAELKFLRGVMTGVWVSDVLTVKASATERSQADDKLRIPLWQLIEEAAVL
jgi:hypothetical protein